MSLIDKFLAKNPRDRNIFIMMKYGDDDNNYHRVVERQITRAFEDVGYYKAIFAKNIASNYSCDLNIAVKIGIDCSARGLAVFSCNQYDRINPNVAFELGIMWAQGKDCLILKDKNVDKLFIDIGQRAYTDFVGGIESLQQDSNDIFLKCRARLTSWKNQDTDIFGMTYLQTFELSINTDPKYAVSLMLEEIEKSLDVIRDAANNQLPERKKISFTKCKTLKRKLIHLKAKSQLTVFFVEVALLVLDYCEFFKDNQYRSKEEIETFIHISRILSDIHNSWVRNYEHFICSSSDLIRQLPVFLDVCRFKFELDFSQPK